MSDRLEQLCGDVESVSQCGCLSAAAEFGSADIAEVIAWRWRSGYVWGDAPKESSDSESYAVVRLADGRMGVFMESEDYTGHGCQCSSFMGAYPTLDEAVRLGLGEQEREDFNSLPR